MAPTRDAGGPDANRAARGRRPEPEAQIRSLESAHAEALLLHHGAGFSVDETARILRVPVSTVKSRRSRADAAVKHLWAEGNPKPRRTKF